MAATLCLDYTLLAVTLKCFLFTPAAQPQSAAVFFTHSLSQPTPQQQVIYFTAARTTVRTYGFG